MSVTAMTAVLKSDVGPVNKRFVLLAIANNANEAGYCWPGVANIVGATSVARSTVFRILKELETEDGLLERRERYRPNGSRTSNVYRLNLELLAQRERVVTKAEQDEMAQAFADAPARAAAEREADESAGQTPVPERDPHPTSEDAPPSRSGTGGSPGAGRGESRSGTAVRPVAGPPEPSVDPSEEGGEASGQDDRPAPEPVQDRNAPLPAIKFSLHDDSTWLCRRHRDNPIGPDEDRPACGACGRTVKWARSERNRKGLPPVPQPGEVEAEERAADARRAGDCQLCDGLHVLAPSGLPIEPLVKCDHETTTPERAAELAAQERARQAAERAPLGTDEGRARAQALYRARPRAAAGEDAETPASEAQGSSGLVEDRRAS